MQLAGRHKGMRLKYYKECDGCKTKTKETTNREAGKYHFVVVFDTGYRILDGGSGCSFLNFGLVTFV
jgi:hypothetical protein